MPMAWQRPERGDGVPASDGLVEFEGADSSRGIHGALHQALSRRPGKCDQWTGIDFEVFWVVSQYAGTPSPVHFHSADISGVLYLKVPEVDTAEEAKTYISGRHAGYINFLIGGKQRFSKSLISFRPRVGDFYIFPGWLLHGAEAFRGEGERRSLSFNATVGAGDV